jgi:hypothetical protein
MKHLTFNNVSAVQNLVRILMMRLAPVISRPVSFSVSLARCPIPTAIVLVTSIAYVSKLQVTELFTVLPNSQSSKANVKLVNTY